MRTREKENRSKETKPEFTHLAIFFFVKQKEDLVGGTTTAKTSPPPYDGGGVVDTGTPEELKPNDRLLQKRARTKSEQEEVLNKRKTSKQLTDA